MKQGWEIKKLGEVCESDLGKTLNQSKDTGELRPYLCAINVLWNKIDFTTLKETRFEDAELERYTIRKGDLLICEGGDIGRAAIWNYDYEIQYQNALHRVRLNDGVLSRFLLLYLKHLKDSGVLDARYGKGVTIKHLVKSSLLSIPIPIPPLAEQERIVAELDCLSGVIEKKKQQLKELDALAQSIFYQMFGDPISNEKGWEVKKLEELCDIINGFAFPSSDFAECNPIKVIKITNVGVNEFISDDSSLPEEYNNMEGCKVHTGDIVIALTRTIISAGVKRAIVPNEYNESLVNQRVAAILANDRIVSRNFLYSFLGTDFVRQYILQKATALMQPNLSIRDLRDMPTIYPPLALQQEFADKIEEIEKQKELIKQSIIETETLFNSRMNYYFN